MLLGRMAPMNEIRVVISDGHVVLTVDYTYPDEMGYRVDRIVLYR